MIREGAVIGGIVSSGVPSPSSSAFETSPGSVFVPLGEALVQLFAFVGAANVLLYVIARGIALSGLDRA